MLSSGTITDRNGEILWNAGRHTGEEILRLATVHSVGDVNGNTCTGALTLYRTELIGWNALYGTTRGGGTVRLTIDSRLNKAAFGALNGRAGTIGVMDCSTGEIICMVSSPVFDPEGGDVPAGAFINRFLSASYVPGSVYKLVTLAAALEELSEARDISYTCTGRDGCVKCLRPHGRLKAEDALAESCNCFYANMAELLGGDTMAQYAAKFGLTGGLCAGAASIKSGRYDISSGAGLAWSGAGQYNNLVTPAALMRFVGAIANMGVTAELKLMSEEKTEKQVIMSGVTAKTMADAMNYCVCSEYGKELFAGTKVSAKSGTAETGTGMPHSWFAGFAEIGQKKLAFTVIIENGGWGLGAAGEAAAKIIHTVSELYIER